MTGRGTFTEPPAAEDGHAPSMASARPTNAYCSKCHTRLRALIDTNGDGVVLELVDPCPNCTRRKR